MANRYRASKSTWSGTTALITFYWAEAGTWASAMGDFTMTSGGSYSVHLAESPGVSIDNLTTDTCTDPGRPAYLGSVL